MTRSGNMPKAATRGKTRSTELSASEKRIRIASKGPEAFAQVYLSHLLRAQTDIVDALGNVVVPAGASIAHADWHLDFFVTADTEGAEGIREAIIAPRGTAKSTAITIVVMYWAAFKLRDFVLWTSETASQVEELVASFIDELDSNEELLIDYPHLAPAFDSRGQQVKYTDRDVVLKGGFRLSARGKRKATRGLRRGGNRPDVVICDDAEGEDSVGDTQYPKTRHWLTRVIGPAMASSGDIFWMNTLIDWTSATGALLRHEEDWTKTWNVQHLEIEWDEDPDGKKIDPTLPYHGDHDGVTHHLLWPGFWPQERIDAYRSEFGEISYMYELRNRPLSDAAKVFSGTALKWFSLKDGWLRPEDKPQQQWIRESLLVYVTALDPAFGGKDYAAVVTVAMFNNDYFVVEAWWERGEQVRVAQVTEARRQAEHYGSRIVVIESVAAQIMVADEFMRQSRIPVKKFNSVQNKVDRALPVAIRASQGHVYFDASGPNVRTLRSIVERFPSAAADDPVDAFVMAVEGAAELKSKFMVSA